MLGIGIGALCWRLNTSMRAIADMNVALCFPKWSASTRARLVRRHIIHYYQLFMELGTVWLRPIWLNARLCKREYGVDLFEQRLESATSGTRRGMVLLLPHIGNWELFCSYLTARFGVDMHVMYSPPRMSHAWGDFLLSFCRRRRRTFTYPANATGVRSMISLLRKGEMVVILPDQEPHNERSGVYAPLFAVRHALTPTLVGRLAKSSQADVFCSFALRVRGGFDIHFMELEGISNMDALSAATTINRCMERVINYGKAQYLWSYKRFKRTLYHFHRYAKYS